MLAVTVAGSAHGQASIVAERAGLKVLDLVVDQPLLEKMRGRLVVSEAQAAEMQRSFNEYWQQVQEIDAQGYQRALDAGLREALDWNASDPREIARMTQLMRSDGAGYRAELHQRAERYFELRLAYHPHILAARSEADDALELWLRRLGEVGVLTERGELATRRMIRRENLDDHGSASSEDFQRVPDPLELLWEASAPGGELEAIRGNADFEELLASAIEQYESAIDVCMHETFAKCRRPIVASDYRPPVAVPADEWAAFTKNVCRRWERRFLAADTLISMVASALDEPAAQAWRMRFIQKMCPEVFQPRLPDKMCAWLQARSDSTPDQRDAVQLLEGEWQTERDALREQVILAGIEAKRDVAWLSRERVEVPALTRYAQRLCALHEAALRFVSQFRANLTLQQQQAFLREFPDLRIKPLDGRLGPPMEVKLLEAARRD
jgi:hypothetical protein